MLRRLNFGEGMANHIGTEELEKAARNLERLSQFMGERRDWLLGMDAERAALETRNSAQALSDLLTEWVDGSGDDIGIGRVRQPPGLEPTGKVSAGRLAKFSEFFNQLNTWFASHRDAPVPADSEQAIQSIRGSLVSTQDALTRLLGPTAIPGSSKPEKEAEEAPDDDPTDFGPLTADDLGPVAEVDINARLILHDTVKKRLLQEFRGVKELTKETRELVDDFFAKQNVKHSENEMRKIYDKVQKWIEGTPEGRVLVVKISGLSGKPEAYSSYRMVEDIEELGGGNN